MKSPIIEDNISKAVNTEKELINKDKVEDSLKKAVKQAEEKATFRDYSGRIRLGESEKTAEPETPKGFEKVVKQKRKAKQQASVIKNNATATAEIEPVIKPVETVGAGNIVKAENADSIIKPQQSDGVVKENSSGSVIKGDTVYKPATDKQTDKRYKQAVKNRQRKAKKQSSVIKPDTIQNDTSIKRLSNDSQIISNSQQAALSATAESYIDKPAVTENKPTAFEKVIHQKQMAMVKENINTGSEPVTYRSDLTEDKVQANAEMVVTNELPLPDNRQSAIRDSTDIDVAYAKEYKNALRNLKKGKNTDNKNLVGFAQDKLKGTVKSALKNSDDETLQCTEKAVTAAATAVEVLKPESVEKARRRTAFDKAKTAETVQNLNIRQELSKQLTTTVSDMNASAKKAIKSVGSTAIVTFRNDIKTRGEDDLAFKAADGVITGVETVRDVTKAYSATKNTAKDVINTGKSAVNAVKNAPQNIANAVEKGRQLKQRYNAYKRLQTKQRISIIKNKGKQTAKKTAEVLAKSVKDIAIKAVAVALSFVILIVAVCGVVAGAIGSYIWDTSAVMDTTKIVKYISTLDYNQQKKWFNKGKTAVAIESQNDNSSDRSYKYYYLIAKDVPADPAFLSKTEDEMTDENITPNTLVTESVNSDGEQLRPKYKGFNEVYYSADDFLENNRWTTEDYRAALAYMQVKCENLGWLGAHIGFVGDQKLKDAAKKLVAATYEVPIIHEDKDADGISTYDAASSEISITYSRDKAKEYYYFGRKYSVKYLIDNDIIRFSSDEDKQREQKERFYYTYKYGNYAVAALSFPLELGDDEKISDRISKHFGEQLTLKYKPPTANPDKTVYGSISSKKTTHWANDLSAESGDIIMAPISGLCVVKQREGRGFEYVISTSYSGTNFKFDDYGYVVKMSCSGSSFLSPGVPTIVTQGQALGKVAGNMPVNYEIPSADNDSENEDIIADCLFPCGTATTFSDIGGDYFEQYPPEDEAHLHIELYSLPCDFSDKSSVKENILAPELFFDYSSEEDEDD